MGTTYTYTMIGGRLYCYKNPKADQSKGGLWETEELTGFHDADLAQATKEINAIINTLETNNKDPNRVLSLVKFQDRLMLVWATYGAVGPYDDEATITKTLKLNLK